MNVQRWVANLYAVLCVSLREILTLISYTFLVWCKVNWCPATVAEYRLCGSNIPVVSSYKYLGFPMTIDEIDYTMHVQTGLVNGRVRSEVRLRFGPRLSGIGLYRSENVQDL